jgi:hypothetical protein
LQTKTFGLILARGGFLDGSVRLDRIMDAAESYAHEQSKNDQELMQTHLGIPKMERQWNIKSMISWVYRQYEWRRMAKNQGEKIKSPDKRDRLKGDGERKRTNKQYEEVAKRSRKQKWHWHWRVLT